MNQLGFVEVPPDADSAWWWEGVEQHRLLLPRCEGCNRCFFPPQSTCPHCGSDAWQTIEASGDATVYSWIVIHIPLHPAFVDDVPYTIIAAELSEGVRLFGRLQDAATVEAGDDVTACFYEVAGRTLVGFRPKR
jgi:uncharacterized OB-fold protein